MVKEFVKDKFDFTMYMINKLSDRYLYPLDRSFLDYCKSFISEKCYIPTNLYLHLSDLYFTYCRED